MTCDHFLQSNCKKSQSITSDHGLPVQILIPLFAFTEGSTKTLNVTWKKIETPIPLSIPSDTRVQGWCPFRMMSILASCLPRPETVFWAWFWRDCVRKGSYKHGHMWASSGRPVVRSPVPEVRNMFPTVHPDQVLPPGGSSSMFTGSCLISMKAWILFFPKSYFQQIQKRVFWKSHNNNNNNNNNNFI
jgi:hypothetical protein